MALRLSLARGAVSSKLFPAPASIRQKQHNHRLLVLSSARTSSSSSESGQHPPPPPSHSPPKFPKRIILLRHGESLGNVDETLYAEIPDWKIPLTRRGERQCLKAAHDLYDLTKGESIFCYCSPYKRTRETWDILRTHLQDQEDVDLIGVREEPRISEQQFGNFQK